MCEKSSSTKFHENPSSESQVIANGQTDRQTDMTKPIVAFGSFADSSQKYDVRVPANVAINVATR
jgi:hypothetical protein